MMWIERMSNKSLSSQDYDKSMNGGKKIKRDWTVHFVTVAVSMVCLWDTVLRFISVDNFIYANTVPLLGQTGPYWQK